MVRELTDRLRRDGIDAEFDGYIGFPPQGWILWSSERLEEADTVLIICNQTYLRRFNGQEGPGTGLGATWEAPLIRIWLAANAKNNTRMLPVVLKKEDVESVPSELRHYRIYVLPHDYKSLVFQILGLPEFPKPSSNENRDLLTLIPAYQSPRSLHTQRPRPTRSIHRTITTRDSKSHQEQTRKVHNVLVEELARVFCNREDAILLIQRSGFPEILMPDFKNPIIFWTTIRTESNNGALRGGIDAIIAEAARLYPENTTFNPSSASKPVDPISVSEKQDRREPRKPSPKLQLIGRIARHTLISVTSATVVALISFSLTFLPKITSNSGYSLEHDAWSSGTLSADVLEDNDCQHKFHMDHIFSVRIRPNTLADKTIDISAQATSEDGDSIPLPLHADVSSKGSAVIHQPVRELGLAPGTWEISFSVTESDNSNQKSKPRNQTPGHTNKTVLKDSICIVS